MKKHVAKLVEIFCALCSDAVTNGDRSSDDDNDDSDSSEVTRKYLHHIGRPISTRYDV